MAGNDRTGVRRLPTLAIVMPALDEEATVDAQVRALRAHRAFETLALAHLRVIVVDNGSRDRTAEVARAAGAEVVREPRRGYGYACLAGVQAAVGADVVLLMDADGSDDLDGAARVARVVLAGGADLAMGARRGAGRERGALTPQQRAGNAVGTLALRLIYGARVSDIAPVRAIRREALLALDPREMAYGWSTEMLAKAARAGLRIVELPVAAHVRAGGTSKVAGTLRGSLGASIHILRTLWRYRDWQPGERAQPAVATAPGGPAATKSASADWDRNQCDAGSDKSGEWNGTTDGAIARADRRALFVVARLPVAGQTKTRLGRAIGHEAAAALYRAFLRDLSARLSAAAEVDGYDLYWYYTAPSDACEAEFAACVATEGEACLATTVAGRLGSIRRRGAGEAYLATTEVGKRRRERFLPQPEGDFAARLWYGFAELAARGYRRIVVLGSDSPQVPAARITAAFAALETRDVALGPARDGGYYLLGQRVCPADLFTGIQMSTPRVAAETLARAAALGLSVAMLPESFDVDEPADLDTLARALARAPSAEADPAPATLAVLAGWAHGVRPYTPPGEVAPALELPRDGARVQPSQREVEGAAHGTA